MKVPKKRMAGLAALAAVATIGGTWAYWSQDLTAVNEFETGRYDSDIIEEFTPPAPGEWVPGVEVEKKVVVSNSGNVKLAVAAQIDQVWIRTEDVKDMEGNVTGPEAGGYFDLMFEDEEGNVQYASIINFGEDVVALASRTSDFAMDAAKDLKIENVVNGLSEEEALDKWVLVDALNDDTNAGRGYSGLKFIYNGIIGEGEATPELLTGATLNEKINTTVTSKTTTVSYDEETGGKKTTTVTETNAKYGYDSARYTMTIHAATAQATKAAIESVLEGKGYSKVLATEFLQVHQDSLIAEKTEAETGAGL